VSTASGILVDTKSVMGCCAGTLCDVYFLIGGALPKGDLNIQFLRCREPCIAFGIKDAVERIVEVLGQFELAVHDVL
jgi:hypothetical protein